MASRLVVEIISDATKFSKGFDAANRQLRGFNQQAGQTNSTFGQLSSRFEATGSALRGIAAVAAGSAILNFGKEAVQSAVALEESVNAVNKIFGTAADTITDFGEQAASTVGLANSEFNQLAVSTGALLTNFGFAAEDAADETLKLAQRASDLASVFNTDVGDALSAVNAALRGETEPIRRFGVALSDAEIRAKAVELGLADTTREVDANGKAVAALELIYQQTDTAAGDFLQTQDDLANSARTAAAQWEDAKATFGSIITPAATASLGFVNKALLSIGTLLGSDTAEGALRLGEGVEFLNDAIRDGDDLYTALSNVLFTLALDGNLTRGSLIALGAQVGITGDDLEDLGRAITTDLIDRGDVSRRTILALAEAFGITDEVLEQLPPLDSIFDLDPEYVRELAEGTAEWAEAQGLLNEEVAETAPAVETLDDKIRDTIPSTKKLIGPFGELNDELFKATQRSQSLGDALLELTNPAFAAAQAQGRLRDAAANLDEVQGDSQATAEDVAQAQLDYASAVLEADAANARFEASGVIEGLEGIGIALGEDIEFVAGLLDILGVLNGLDVVYNIEGRVSEVPVDPASLFTRDDQAAVAEDRSRIFGPTPQFVGGVPFFPEGSSSTSTVNNNTEINVYNPQTEDLDGDLQRAGLIASFTGSPN